jgi:hypothetical protein
MPSALRRDFTVNDIPKTGGELVARHAELIGRVTLMWSDVHRQIGQLFEQFVEPDEERKRAYWDMPSDAHQRQLARPAGSIALKEYPDLLGRFEQVLDAVDSIARDRNAAIHTYWAIDLPAGKIIPHRRVPPHKALRDDFEVQFKQLLEKLQDHWLALFDLNIDYFDRKAGLPAGVRE